MSDKKHLQAAGYSIASDISVQLLNRGFTFVLRAITLNYLQSSALLGIIHVRLALLYTTLQFLSREPFRRACLGEAAKRDSRGWQKIVNTIWLGLVFSFILSIPLAYIWRLNSPGPEDLVGTTVSDYHVAVLLVCLTVIFEMLVEPCFIYAQAKAIPEHNPRVEVFNVTLKSLLTVAITVIESSRYTKGQSSHILTKIAVCQVLAAATSVIYSYYALCKRQKLKPTIFFPSLRSQAKQSTGNIAYQYLDEASVKLTYSFVSQTFLKQFLTEGERYVMTFFNIISLGDQGIYDVVINLGSLAARLVFKPIEDSGYTLFSKTVSRTEILDIRKFYRVQENLMLFIKSSILIGLIVLIFGYNFVPLIVIYGGEKLNNELAFRLMRWQLFYTPFLSVNGITECFTFAIMSTKQIRNYNYNLILFSVIFLISVYLTQPMLGSACFIFSNCLIMTLRIFYSYKFIGRYFDKHGYKLQILDTMPSLTTLISMSGVFIFLTISQHYLLDMTQPLTIMFGLILGAWCLLFIAHVIVCHEEALVNFASRLFKIKLS